jgi:hypothetical protein
VVFSTKNEEKAMTQEEMNDILFNLSVWVKVILVLVAIWAVVEMLS